MFRILLILIFFPCCISANAQNPSITYQNHFGGSGNDIMNRIAYNDHSSYFVGYSHSDISGDKTENSRGFSDIWVVKTDNNHNILWDKTIGGDYYDDVRNALIVDDTIYVLSESASGVSGEKTIPAFGGLGWTDLWLVALDTNGNLLWQEQYGGSLGETNSRIIELNNGNLLIACVSNSDVSGNKTEPLLGLNDIWLLEISKTNGSIINQKVFGTTQGETLADIVQLADGTFLIKAGAQTGIDGDKTDLGYGSMDIWLLHVSSSFDVLEDKCFGGDNYESGLGGQILLHDGYYYLSNSSQSGMTGNKSADNFGGSDYWLIKLDQNFDIIWDKTYGGTMDDGGGGLLYLDNQRLLLSGSSLSGANGNKTAPAYGDYDMWLLILDLDGNIIGQESYGGSGIDVGSADKQADASKVFINSYSTSGISGVKTVPSHGGYDYWFMELDISSFLNVIELNGGEGELLVYPNPTNGKVTFQYNEAIADAEIRIYTVEGKLVSNEILPAGASAISMNFDNQNQVLLYELITDENIFTGKIVLN